MTILKEITIICDGKTIPNGLGLSWPCDNQIEKYDLSEAKFKQELKHLGWTREGKKDYCPTCSKVREFRKTHG